MKTFTYSEHVTRSVKIKLSEKELATIIDGQGSVSFKALGKLLRDKASMVNYNFWNDSTVYGLTCSLLFVLNVTLILTYTARQSAM